MRKIISVILLVVLVVLLTACGKGVADIQPEETSSVERMETEEDSLQEAKEDSDEKKTEKSGKKYKGIYDSSLETVEIPMGVNVGETSTKLFTITIPADAIITGSCDNENGHEILGEQYAKSAGVMDGRRVREKIDLMDASEMKYITTLYWGSCEGCEGMFTVIIKQSPKNQSATSWAKNKFPDGAEIKTESAHPGYSFSEDGGDKRALFIDINDDWCVQILGGKPVPTNLSVEEYGNIVYDLIKFDTEEIKEEVPHMKCVATDCKLDINRKVFEEAEKEYSISIRDDIKEFLELNSGGYPLKSYINIKGEDWEVRVFESLDPSDEYYYIKEPLDFFMEFTGGKMIPIAEDSGGNYFCVDNETGKVYFWIHDGIDEEFTSLEESSDFECVEESLEAFSELFLQ